MRHPCKECGATYRYPHDLDEHKRVGCRVQSATGETWLPEEVEEVAAEEPVIEEAAVEELVQEISPEPESEEKESSQWQELT